MNTPPTASPARERTGPLFHLPFVTAKQDLSSPAEFCDGLHLCNLPADPNLAQFLLHASSAERNINEEKDEWNEHWTMKYAATLPPTFPLHTHARRPRFATSLPSSIFVSLARDSIFFRVNVQTAFPASKNGCNYAKKQGSRKLGKE